MDKHIISFHTVTPVDAAFVAHVRRQSAEFLHDPTIYSVKDVYDWVEKNGNSLRWFIISCWDEDIKRHRSVGYIRTSIIDDKLYVGMDIEIKYRGMGLSQAAYKQFFPTAYIMSGKKDIWLEVLKTNSRAIHIYEKLGFELVEEKTITRNGQNEISLVYKRKYNGEIHN